jgi:ketosteroid isomerase-like protein
VTATPQEIFERYVLAGAMTRNPDSVAALFTEDGVIESPLVDADAAYPRRMVGREAIRAGLAAYYERSPQPDGTVDFEQSRYVLHTTADPDVFIAEIDTAFNLEGQTTTVSLVQIFRVRGGAIVLLRDYFAPHLVA